ncbi:GNAT family N-acetyltransferase [Deinococcus sp. QL22]|uniref:GNAT family N-acetyltransferase n=1 Tax=Deinococcus sp. QL22 TaxID=2939437 RepID=UPI00201701D2|nr:GNAT family N-acetyltransferase [Deinococcus sp. QL22]UQN09388.1 GNAT family N-acetyltransferase [Deinococcus sp. QL22]
MLELKPMTAASYATFLTTSLVSYAQEKVASGEWQPEDAPENARLEFAELLPQGVETPLQFLFDLHDFSRSEQVGVLWFALRGSAQRRRIFVYDVLIYPQFQRQGYAAKAFELLQEKAQTLEAKDIRLHVFGHNQGAIALYEKLGFVMTNIIMQLDLSASEGV